MNTSCFLLYLINGHKFIHFTQSFIKIRLLLPKLRCPQDRDRNEANDGIPPSVACLAHGSPNRRCQLTHRLPVSRLPTLLDRPHPRDEPQQHVPLLGKVSKRAQSKSFHSSIRPQSSFKWPHLRRALLPTTSTTTADSSSTHSVPERLVLVNGQELPISWGSSVARETF